MVETIAWIFVIGASAMTAWGAFVAVFLTPGDKKWTDKDLYR